MKTERIKRYKQGLWAERLAAWYLRCKGYRILAQRFKTPVGEIDLIARRGTTLAFIEVKLRPSHEDGLWSVTPRAQGRIGRAAQVFLAHKPQLADCVMRFDVITIAPRLNIRHLDNAWRPPA